MLDLPGTRKLTQETMDLRHRVLLDLVIWLHAAPGAPSFAILLSDLENLHEARETVGLGESASKTTWESYIHRIHRIALPKILLWAMVNHSLRWGCVVLRAWFWLSTRASAAERSWPPNGLNSFCPVIFVARALMSTGVLDHRNVENTGVAQQIRSLGSIPALAKTLLDKIRFGQRPQPVFVPVGTLS